MRQATGAVDVDDQGGLRANTTQRVSRGICSCGTGSKTQLQLEAVESRSGNKLGMAFTALLSRCSLQHTFLG